jgi:SulP family sulfate permease
MINGATGVRAAVVAPYVKEYGVEFLFYIILAISFWQILAAAFRLSRLIRLVPRPVFIGFVDGLAVIIAMGQIPQFQEVKAHPDDPAVWRDATTIGWMVFLTLVTILVSILMPKVPKIGPIFPPSMWGILWATIVEYALIRPVGYKTPQIGDLGDLEGGFPKFFFTDPQYEIPSFTGDTLSKIWFPALVAAAAGMCEALLTINVVNDITDTENPRPDQQLFALGVGNALGGLFGTMGGGATIGVTVVNLHSGSNGRYRISGVMTGITMLLIIVVLSPVIRLVPTSALVGVMAFTCFHTFDWPSIALVVASALPLRMRRHKWLRAHTKVRRWDAIIIVVVTAATLALDLFTAVVIGVALSAITYAWDSAATVKVDGTIVETEEGSQRKVYRVRGPIFFANALTLPAMFDPKNDPDTVELHFHDSEVHDFSGLHALNAVGEAYTKRGKRVHLRHLSDASTRLIRKADRLATAFTYEDGEVVEDGEVDLGPAHHFNVTKSS